MNIHSCKARSEVIFYRLDRVLNRGDYVYRLLQCLVRDFFLCFSLELSRVAYTVLNEFFSMVARQ